LFPDDSNIFDHLAGIEYLNFMADVYKVSPEIRSERMQELLKRFEMTSAAGDLIQSYSHGMKQKIVVIGALCSVLRLLKLGPGQMPAIPISRMYRCTLLRLMCIFSQFNITVMRREP